MLRDTLADLRHLFPGAAVKSQVETVQKSAAAELREAASCTPEELFAKEGTSSTGLSSEVAEERLKSHGPNQVAHEHPPHWYLQLWHGFANAFSTLLAVLATVSWVTGDHESAYIIGSMVLLSGLLRFFQERRASLAAQKLQEMVRVTCTVMRSDSTGRQDREIPIHDLVPGDVVKLSAGDMIPADVRLLSAKDLFVAQSALTGEALPVEKVCGPASQLAGQPGGQPAGSPLELCNMAFLGTNVTSGTATALVVKTGEATYLGKVAESLVGQRPPTSFEVGIRGVSLLLLRFMAVMTVLVFFINGLTKHDWKEAFFFALAVAVGLTPEMLPMIMSGTLAIGALSLSKKKVIVKRLNSIQNFGAMDILCTDKTGTLTQDRVVLEKYCNVVQEEDPGVLEMAFFNSHFQTGLKNLLDKAVLAHGGIHTEHVAKIDEIPFDFSRRIMSVVVDVDSRRRLIAKGAPEAIFKICTHVELNDEIQDLDPLILPDLVEELDQLQAQGFRVLAIAYKDVPADRSVFSKQDERDLVLRGYVAFLDPPKPSTREALSALDKHGVTVKVLTGDNDIVSKKICADVGLQISQVVLGRDVEAASDAELAKLAEEAVLFARLSPAHKERIVMALRQNGHVVGFLGDGINDAPALRGADVGISVDNAVDIAKESADLILLEKDLLVLEHGVVEGRRVFGNIIKYIKMGTSSNFGNMFSVLGASALLPFLPMLPIQLLTQNLLYDFSQLAIPFDRVDDEYLARPRQWKIEDIQRFMLWFGPTSSIFDYVTFGLMWFVLKANSPEHQSLFQSAWFVEGLLSQTLIVHMIRTRKIPFLQSNAARALTLATLSVMAIGVALPFTPFGASLGMVALPVQFFGWLALILLAYCVLAQVVKTWFVKKYGYN